MEIITGVERRRRWRLEEKLRLVAETEQPRSGIAEVARRYEVSRDLRETGGARCAGVLRPEPPPVFLPVKTISEPATGSGAKHVGSSSATGADPAVSGGQIEITLPDGISVKVGHDVGLATLRRVLSVLRR